MSYRPDEEIIDAEFVEVPMEKAESTASESDVLEVPEIVAEGIAQEIPEGMEMPPQMPPQMPGQMQLPADVAAALLESTEGDTLTNQVLIDFLNSLSAQKLAENTSGEGNLDETLKNYENLQNPIDNEQVVSRKNVKAWLNRYDVSQTLMDAMAKSFLVTEEGFQAMMMSPIFKDQPVAPFIRAWNNKAMNKVFKRFNLWLMLSCFKKEENAWMFGIKRLDHPDMVIRIAKTDDMDYETAAGMAFCSYLRELHR
jgi:hypothetical protein